MKRRYTLSDSRPAGDPRGRAGADDGEASEPEKLQPISDLDLMIKNGWGDTRQTKLPSDWRTRRNAVTLERPKPGRARAHA